MQNRKLPGQESGFAMLFVFLLAAVVAISLYMELPRVVFEAQRSREELLIARGEQYKRAIQLYFRATRQYPPSLDALENTNNRRFLRKRYKDPMTGEEDWRIVHAGPGGVLTDSLVTKPPESEKETESSTTASAAEPPPPVWLQQRPSDRGMQPGLTQGSLEQPVPESQEAAAPPVEQQLAAYPPPAEGQPSPVQEPGLAQPTAGPGQPPGPNFQPGFPMAPQVSGQQPPYPPVPIPGLQQPSGQPYVQLPVISVPGQRPMPPVQPGMAQPPSPAQTTGTSGPFGQPGLTGPQAAPGSNPAGEMIHRLLTTPNPRGLAAIQQASTPAGQRIGGGIAGVATKLEAEGIKVYGDRTKYNEWEFVYDPRQDRSAAGLMRGVRGPQTPTGSRPVLDDRLRRRQ